jgi:hypothetical protein
MPKTKVQNKKLKKHKKVYCSLCDRSFEESRLEIHNSGIIHIRKEKEHNKKVKEVEDMTNTLTFID